MIELSHFTREPLTEIRPAQQEGRKKIWKPAGLWVSVDGEHDWLTWCQAEDYNVEGLKHRYRIVLKDFAMERLLHIKTVPELDAFTHLYGDRARDPLLTCDYIDWALLASEHAGIIISPYQWERRMEYLWYYGWDCASGCIWDPTVIDHFELIGSPLP